MKINKEKLFKYTALSLKNHNSHQKSNKLLQMKTEYSDHIMKDKQLNRTQSIKTIKDIKHKMTPNSTRYKTQSDKENIFRVALPKMMTKG